MAGMSLLDIPLLELLDPRDGELVVDAVGEEGLLAFQSESQALASSCPCEGAL